MKKLLVVVLGLVVAAFSIAAKEKVVINMLHYVDATAANYPVDEAIFEKFQKDNPDIELKQEILFNDPYHQKVAAYIAAGQMPDFLYMWPSGRSSEIHAKKLTKDLTPLLGKEFLKKFVPAAIEPNNQGGKRLAMLPQSVTYTHVLYANKKLIESLGMKLPKTYAELKAMVPKLKAKGIATILMANKDTWPMQSCLFSTISGRLLGDNFVDDVLAGNAKFTDKEFVDALGFVARLYKDGVLSKDTIQIGYGETPALFAAGKAAFMIDGDWRIGDFLTNKDTGKALIEPSKQNSDFVFMQFPVIPGEKNSKAVSAVVGVGYGIGAGVAAGSEKEKATVKLIKYLYSDEVQKQRLESGAFIPSKKGITSDKLEPFTINMSKYYASIPKTSYVLDAVFDGSVIVPLNNGLQEIGMGTKTPAQVAEEMQKAFDIWAKK